jgi:SAM-dependent methyltransferase
MTDTTLPFPHYGFFNPAKVQLKEHHGIGTGDDIHGIWEYPKNQRVLEIGYGKGYMLKRLAEDNNDVYGIDVSETNVRFAINDTFKDCPELVKRVALLRLDASHDEYPLIDDFFDTVFCLECIEHLECPIHMFQEVKRVLKPNGYFVLEFPRPEGNLGWGTGKHIQMVPGILLKKSFRLMCMMCWFKIIKYMENGSSAWYVLKNIKHDGIIGVHHQIDLNVDEKEYYKELFDEEAYNEKNDPEYFVHYQAMHLMEGAKIGVW